MTYNEMIERYEEFQRQIHYGEYTLDACEMQEYQELCADLLYIIMQNNADVLKRLKDR